MAAHDRPCMRLLPLSVLQYRSCRHLLPKCLRPRPSEWPLCNIAPPDHLLDLTTAGLPISGSSEPPSSPHYYIMLPGRAYAAQRRMLFQCPQKFEATASGFSEASPSFLNRMQYPEPHRLAGCKASPASENTRGRVPISETAARSQAFCSAGRAQSKHYLRFV